MFVFVVLIYRVYKLKYRYWTAHLLSRPSNVWCTQYPTRLGTSTKASAKKHRNHRVLLVGPKLRGSLCRISVFSAC
jgi:hypothetical protein